MSVAISAEAAPASILASAGSNRPASWQPGSMPPPSRRANGRPKGTNKEIKKDNTALKKAEVAACNVKITNQLVELLGRRPQLGPKILEFAQTMESEFKDSIHNDIFPRNYYRIKQAGVVTMLNQLVIASGWTQRTWARIRTQP
eukprot:8986129-Heterocapsa_arctica.AAC.1